MITIIIPVYNVETYLSRCIDSVLRQNYVDYELLLVDDGSSDKSGEICDYYAKKDKRIRVFHKENGGVSTARNIGLDEAKGDWVAFVDSDDWLEASYLQNFVEQIDCETELIIQSFWNNWEYVHKEQKVVLPTCHIEGNDKLVQWLEDTPFVHNGFIWHRLFRKEIIEREHVRFPKGISFAEDGWFFFQYLRRTQHYKVTSNAGYHYFIRQDSLTSQGKRVSLEVHDKVLRGYITSLSAFLVPKERQEEHFNFIKRYSWRLAESWILRPGLSDSITMQKNLFTMYAVIQEYDLDKVENIPITLRWLISCLKIRSVSRKIQLIGVVMWIRKYEQKIKRHL